jgi:anti-sigma B factor antagonist
MTRAKRDNALILHNERVPERRKLTLTLHEQGAAKVLHVGGDVDLSTAPSLRDAALTQLELAPAVLVLDFGDVGFLASAGLSTLTSLLDTAGQRTKLHIVAGPIAYRAIELSGLADELTLFSTLEDALSPP